MMSQQIIEPASEHSDWVNAIVVTRKKSGDVKICLDPRPLNKVIKRQQYPLPLFDDIVFNLAGAKYFTVLDAKCGYSTSSIIRTSFIRPLGQKLYDVTTK